MNPAPERTSGWIEKIAKGRQNCEYHCLENVPEELKAADDLELKKERKCRNTGFRNFGTVSPVKRELYERSGKLLMGCGALRFRRDSKIQGMTVVDNLEAYLEANCYKEQACHTDYLGNRKGLSNRKDADDEIFAIYPVQRNGDGLIKKQVLMAENSASYRRLSDVSKSYLGRCEV